MSRHALSTAQAEIPQCNQQFNRHQFHFLKASALSGPTQLTWTRSSTWWTPSTIAQCKPSFAFHSSAKFSLILLAKNTPPHPLALSMTYSLAAPAALRVLSWTDLPIKIIKAASNCISHIHFHFQWVALSTFLSFLILNTHLQPLILPIQLKK